MAERYNGWTNYETWAAFTWLSNDAGSDSYWREAGWEALAGAEATPPFTREEQARFALADRMKEEVETGDPLETEGREADLYTDLLHAALKEINWTEVARAFLE